MAIAPNTTFTTQVLTSTQMNAFGFSTCQYNSKTTSDAVITTITTTITLSSFTAIASRNYKITYFEPVVFCTSGVGELTMTLKNNATTIATCIAPVSTSVSGFGILQFVTTLTAGASVITSHLTYGGVGSATASRTALRTAFVLVEDIGPA